MEDDERDKEIVELEKQVVLNGYSQSEKYIFCPYCGSQMSDEGIYTSKDIQCSECSIKFHCDVEYSVSYSTSKIEKNI